MERGTFHDLPVGCPIFTSDGDKLGEVKEVRSGFFKVEASMQPDYWLSTSHVTSTSGDRVVLDFVKDHLGDYKTDGPDEQMRERRVA
jgi:hypothetical protein